MPLLSQTIHLLIELYKHVQHSAFLYILSICIDIYGATQHMINQQLNHIIIYEISIITLKLLNNSTEMYIQHSDIVEDYYELCNRILIRCNHVLLNNNNNNNILLLDNIIQSSLYGISLQQHDSFAALMTFYQQLFTLATTKSRYNLYKPVKQISNHIIQIVYNILITYGQDMINQFIYNIIYNYTSYRTQYIVSTLWSMLEFNTEQLHIILYNTFKQYQYNNINNDIIIQQIINAENIRILRNVIEEWSKQVRPLIHITQQQQQLHNNNNNNNNITND